MSCPCGCPDAVTPGRTYARRGCYSRTAANKPQVMAAVAKSVVAMRASHAKAREAKASKYATKGVAYVAGYRAGYTTAMRWWQEQFRRKNAA